MPDTGFVSLDADPPVDIPIGIIGGYGFTERMQIEREFVVETPYGEPTHPVVVGQMAGRRVAFLSRHGRGRNVPSQSVNYRANMFALYRLGVRRIISATANGSLRPEIEVGDVAIPADYIDRTRRRGDTMFDDYPPRHFNSHAPFCPELRAQIRESCSEVNLTPRGDDLTLVVIEGPRFSTPAESMMFQQWGADIVGGSTYPEVTLARELGMCYSNFALITDYDAGVSVPGVADDPVTLEMIDERLEEYNTETRSLMETVIGEIDSQRCSACSGHVEPATSEGDPAWEYRREDML